jgi:hypothetical protein
MGCPQDRSVGQEECRLPMIIRWRSSAQGLALSSERLSARLAICAQAKLLEAQRAAREAEQRACDAREALTSERAQLEQAVRCAREDGAVKLQALEEAVRKLGSRSDLHQVPDDTRSLVLVGLGHRTPASSAANPLFNQDVTLLSKF